MPILDSDLKAFIRDLDHEMTQRIADYMNAPNADEQRSHPL